MRSVALAVLALFGGCQQAAAPAQGEGGVWGDEDERGGEHEVGGNFGGGGRRGCGVWEDNGEKRDPDRIVRRCAAYHHSRQVVVLRWKRRTHVGAAGDHAESSCANGGAQELRGLRRLCGATRCWRSGCGRPLRFRRWRPAREPREECEATDQYKKRRKP